MVEEVHDACGEAVGRGKWVPHPVSVKGGGLLGAVEGMQRMREGTGPSGEKWVYRVEETEWLESSAEK